MLKRLATKNFRKLTNHELLFSPGMQIIRGGNEIGKSTACEAIGYVMFGAKALRTPLADAVTWGQKDSALKVELDIEIEGKLYRITRSKSGAEVNYEGGKVTGQTETAGFIGSLLGVSSQNVNRLMLAKQNQIRGALDQGPAATMQMIEELSDFAVLDRVIEAIQQKLVTGPSKWLEERVEAASAVLDQKRAACSPPDVSSLQAALAAAGAAALQVKETLTNVALPARDQASAKVQAIFTAQQTKDRLEKNLLGQKLREATLKDEIIAYGQQSAAPYTDEQVQQHVAKVRAEQIHEARLDGYKTLLGIQAAVADKSVFWEGDWPSLTAEVQQAGTKVDLLKEKISEAKSSIAQWNMQITTSSICGFCQKDFSSFPEVAAKNAELKAKIEVAAGHLHGWTLELGGAQQELTQLKDLVRFAQAVEARYGRIITLVTLDTTQVPAAAAWKGEVPEDRPANVEEARKQLNAAETALARAKQAALTVAQKQGALAAVQAEMARTVAELDAVVVEDPIAAMDEKVRRVAEVADLQEQLDEAKASITTIEAEIRLAEAVYQQALAAVAQAEKDLAAAQAELVTLNFNNALLKKVRNARPMIANKLWNTVLAAVSHYATQMRGVPSVVTKEADGFKVDGQAVESLSGSALDVLGLAIRLALVRTFLPTAPFLILDEAGAAMDDQRHAAMMGFLLTAGIPQTLVITHHDVDESAAANLIVLGD